jgi:hypothetical protein
MNYYCFISCVIKINILLLQNIYKKARTLGLTRLLRHNDNAWKIVSMVMSLPLLPMDLIVGGLGDIIVCARDNNVYYRLRPWFNYVRRQWIDGVGVHQLSVYGLLDRTNNWVESFYNTMRTRCRVTHPNCWLLTSEL